MIDLNAFTDALTLLQSDPMAWLVVIPGLIVGLLFGAIPGLSISIAMAVFLPATLYMEFLPAVLFLTAIFTGGGFGGAVPAILMNIPGTSSAVATSFDGYPMSKNGQHGEALGAGLIASAMGTLFGYIILMFLVSPVAGWVLMLGPTEMLVVAIWGLLLIAILNNASIAKGLAAGLLGILISTIGYSDSGLMRGTFGSMYLLDGIPSIPALIGLFAASEMISLAGRDYLITESALRKIQLKPILYGAARTLRGWPGVLRGSILGTMIGIIPGVGASVANLASYATAKKLSDDPEGFGKGKIDGVVASEAANSSSEGGGMVTLLALGLPGGAGTAILLGAFAMHNVTGGPRFISDNTDVVYALILGNIVQAILLIAVGLVFVFLASSIVKVRLWYLIPYVLAVSMMGSYAITGSMVGPLTVAGAGALGWTMRRYGYPVTATVVGLLIGPMAEGELTRSWQISGGDPAFLLGRPITLVMLAILILVVATLLFARHQSCLRSAPR